MKPHELEAVMLKLSGGYEANGKRISKAAYDFWVTEVFSGHEYEVCIAAVRECVLNPEVKLSPEFISDHIKRHSKKNNEESQGFIYRGNCPLSLAALKLDANNEKRAADNIADAYRIYHKLIYGHTGDGNEIKTKMTQQEALEIVNKNAAKYNNPESIDPKYRIDSYFEKNL